MATREEILETLCTIIVETRGVEEDEVKGEANLFTDLGLESIDMLEISFRMEEEFGFPFPTDELGNAVGGMTEDSGKEEIETLLDRLESEFFIPVDKDNLDGFEPLDSAKLREAVLGLFTVGALVNFVENRMAAGA